MKNTFAEYIRSIVPALFLAIMVAGPICALGGIIISSLGANPVWLVASAVLLP